MYQFSNILILALALGSTRGQSLLTAEILNVTLPFPNNCATTYYDGDDKIYLAGGCASDFHSSFYVFSISSETIEMAGARGDLPSGRIGTIHGDRDGNVVIIGAASNFIHNEVYQYDPITNSTRLSLTRLVQAVGDATSIKKDEDTVLILGGGGQFRSILAFDLNNLTSSIVALLLPYDVYRGTSVRAGDSNKAYIFDDAGQGHVLELDLDSLDLRQVGPPTLPLHDSLGNPSSVWSTRDNLAYVIGGYQPEIDEVPTNGIIQFDPETEENVFISVNNFPVEGLSYYTEAPKAAYVEKLDRIYFFGGWTCHPSNGCQYHKTIFYIDLEPLSRSK